MPRAGQAANVEAVPSIGSGTNDLSGLIHANFKGRVYPHIEFMGPTLSIFDTMGAGEFNLLGSKLVFSGQLLYSGGAMATPGDIPDHEYADSTQFETVPARIYVRRAVDDFAVSRAQGEGAFDNFINRVMEQMWEAFERTQNRHVHGSTNGYIALANGVTTNSNQTLVLKDGLNWTGADPLQFIEPGMTLAWLDASNSLAVGGTGVVASVDYSANEITFAAAFDGTPAIAADDPIVFATTNDSSATYFATEYGNAPLGLQDLIDPNSNNSTYLSVAEATYPRLQPVRETAATLDEVVIMEFAKKIQSKSTSPISPQSHVMTCSPGAVIELAKSLLPYTQINQKGQDLQGGWETVRIGGFDFAEDPWHLPDVIYALCKDDARVIKLDGDERLYAEDGSAWSRLADFDGREAFARVYLQRILTRRNRCGSLSGFTVSNSTDYTPTPNY